MLELGLEDSAGGAGAFDGAEAPDAVVLLLVQLSPEPVEMGLCMGLKELKEEARVSMLLRSGGLMAC